MSDVSYGTYGFPEFPDIRTNCIESWYNECKPSQEAVESCPGLEGYELQKLLTGFPIVKTYYEQKVCDAGLAWALSECKGTKDRFNNAEKIRNMFCYCNNLRKVFLKYKMSIENYLCTKGENDKENVQNLEGKIRNFGNFIETSGVSFDDKYKNKKWSFKMKKKRKRKCKFKYMEYKEEIEEMKNSIKRFSEFCEGMCNYIGVYKEIFEDAIKKEGK